MYGYLLLIPMKYSINFLLFVYIINICYKGFFFINISISYYRGLSKYNLIFSRYKKFYNKLTFTK